MNLKKRQKEEGKRQKVRSCGWSGFTLIEVIASLALVAVLAAILWPYFATGLRGTVETNQQLSDAYELRTEMEECIEHYRFNWPDLSDPESEIVPYSPKNREIAIETEWVTFEPGLNNILEENPSGESSDFLKITVGHPNGLQLTYILTGPRT